MNGITDAHIVWKYMYAIQIVLVSFSVGIANNRFKITSPKEKLSTFCTCGTKKSQPTVPPFQWEARQSLVYG